MAATVRIRQGNIFDGASDLIVLPCSTLGTVTSFVAKTLSSYHLPHPPKMALGGVTIDLFKAAPHIASWVAFAASVANFTSSLQAIAEIGRCLGEETAKNALIRRVAAPLLGANSGGLAPNDCLEALTRGFLSAAPDDALLEVSVIRPEHFEQLRAHHPASPVGPPRRRVFISHGAKDGPEVQWLTDLATWLNQQPGILARLDRTDLLHGMDFVQWMCNEVVQADRVILVCDELYRQRADGRLGGVGWETMLIQGDLYFQPFDSTKYQIVVRTEALLDGLPRYLKTRRAFHAPPSGDEAAFRNELLSVLLREDAPTAAPSFILGPS